MPVTSVSVVICAYSDERREQLYLSVQSVAGQRVAPLQIIAVIDHNERLMQDVAKRFPGITVIANRHRKGLSGARNSGLEVSRGDVVAFLDDDAIADDNWIENMLALYADADVIGTGGKVMPLWPERRPPWLPEEFDWVVGCSYRGQPENRARIRNPIGCNMSVRRDVSQAVGGFREGTGRTANDASGCEETEFFIRASELQPSSKVLYDPAITVQHQISADRTSWAYFCKRCIAEGRSKTSMVSRVGSSQGLAAERSYVVRVLPLGVLRGLSDLALKRNAWGLARAVNIIAGLGLTACGYTQARFFAAGK
ncbi:MAG: hypothetical protein RJA94_775 [Pseudomonadota bacterium]|jgi:GT2 family glycosyltransferase